MSEVDLHPDFFVNKVPFCILSYTNSRMDVLGRNGLISRNRGKNLFFNNLLIVSSVEESEPLMENVHNPTLTTILIELLY